MSSPALSIDFETRSPVDLRKCGVYVYAENPNTDLWCAAFALGNEAPRLWLPGQPCPDNVRRHVEIGGIVTAWNANFERVLWRHVLSPKYGWPEPKLEQWRCSMAAAMALSLPAGLDDCASALGLDTRKDDAGYRVMMQVSKPRRIEADGTIIWWDVPEKLESLYRYVCQDVAVERAILDLLMPLRPSEQELWFVDQRINDRGVHVDVDLCESANAIADEMQKRLDRAMRKATANEVRACTNSKQLTEWLNQQGIACDSVAKEHVDRMLGRDDLPENVREALLLRQQGSKTSTAKADALLRGMSADGRARGLTQYHAASTGRWGGRRFQPQNLKRPDEDTDIPEAINLIKTRNLDAMLLFYDDPVSIVGDCIRGMVTAAPNRVLRAADFSNIEGRDLAWLAGEQWKLDAFAAYDRFLLDDKGQRIPNPKKRGAYLREGPELYEVTAGAILDKPAAEVTKEERQRVGKIAELALGYQGGVGALMTMSKGKVPFHELYDMLAGKMPDHAEKAAEAYEQRGRGQGLSATGWQAAEIIKLAWRANHPKIVQFWRDAEDAAIDAIANPGGIYAAGKIKFRKVGSFLFMQLPSGRCLAYAYPSLGDAETPWGKPIKKIRFWGVDSLTKKWSKQETYGGKLVENATQAAARDKLADRLVWLDRNGWDPVLHVHDEAVTETAPDFGSTEELERIMSTMPAWAAGCPVAAAGWSEERYRK